MPSVSFPFPETNLAQGVRALKEERVKICDKMGRRQKTETKRVSPCLFQVFDVPGDGGDGDRRGNCEEEKDGTVG